ncbi:apoptosis-associated speck-like protein containing a CARD isoform X1 [Manis javanica]|uniref:apoptosis-associated speck-like protein containing a CARD isoform X1 n=1 Tax=Manis javanica TaxID=9974 RepID=UPI00187A321D|nr:apoptosis-associated speck-like protein containing a CARD isoform X1 [Manis javanica]
MERTRDAILDALENLTAEEFKKFKLKLLSVPLREGYGRIPRGTLLPMDAVDLTDKLVSFYLDAYGAELTALVLREMGMLKPAEQLQIFMGKGPRAAPAGIKAPPEPAAKPARSTTRELTWANPAYPHVHTSMSTALCGPAQVSTHHSGHRCGRGARCPLWEDSDGGAVPGCAGRNHQPNEDKEALQLCSSLEPDLQGSAPSGPEGYPALPGERPGTELRHLSPAAHPSNSSQLTPSLI